MIFIKNGRAKNHKTVSGVYAALIEPPLAPLLLWDDCEKDESLYAVRNQAVRMSFRAIVAYPGRENFPGSVAKRLSCSRKDKNNFAARFMEMRANRCAGREPSMHNAVVFVREHPRISGLLPAIEVLDFRFIQLVKINPHALFLPVFDFAPLFFR